MEKVSPASNSSTASGRKRAHKKSTTGTANNDADRNGMTGGIIAAAWPINSDAVGTINQSEGLLRAGTWSLSPGLLCVIWCVLNRFSVQRIKNLSSDLLIDRRYLKQIFDRGLFNAFDAPEGAEERTFAHPSDS